MPVDDTPDDVAAERARKRHAAKLRRLRKATKADPSIRPCVLCLEIKSLGEFSKANPARCRVCASTASRERRRLTPGSVYDTERHRLRRKMLDDAKNRPCADCGGRFPPYVMDFDHRDPREKVAAVGHFLTSSIERLVAEVAKCDVVCSNCHRIRSHHQRQAQLFPQPGRRRFADSSAAQIAARIARKGGPLSVAGEDRAMSAADTMAYLGVRRSFLTVHLTSRPDYVSLGRMSSADVLAYLVEKQRDERISGMEMALRLGISETNWSHARRGRRGLTVKQIERAIHHYPDLSELFALPEAVEEVAS